MSDNSELTNKKIERYVRGDLIDFVNLRNVMQGNARIKAGMITRKVGDQTITYPDVIDLLAAAHNENHFRSDQDLNAGRNKFAPMHLDTFFYSADTRYRNVNNNSSQSSQVTVGYGLYYHRTSIEVIDDDEYFYIRCSFDLYIDERLTTPRAGTLGINDESRLIRSMLCHEEDTQLQALVTRITGRSPQARNQRGYYGARSNLQLPNTEANRNELRRFLIRDRFPLIRETAMSKTRVPNALHSCVAIKKTMKLAKKQDNANSNMNMQYPWFYPTRFTEAIRQGRLIGHSKAVDYSMHTVGDGVTPKRHTMRFVGFMSTNTNRHLVASLICTDEVPGDLTAIMKRQVARNTYPKTQSKRLLSVNALLATYTTDEFKNETVDITTVLPDWADLTLVRVGDCEAGRSGESLIQYCVISDGVYEINIATQSWLRKDKKKMKIEPGKYVVCVPQDETDLLKYNEIVGKSLDGIIVEPVKTRLSLTKGPSTTKKVVTARKSKRARLFSSDMVGAAKSKGDAAKSVRSSRAGSIFGKSKKKNE
tara:strand:+ start:1830 stop:3437 length:1608 start_codon:yes stop_codon:yes gene_type:complete